MEDRFSDYFLHLKKISFLGLLYKRFISSTFIFLSSRRFGYKMLEVGSGVGSGMLGAHPKYVVGVEINPISVEYSLSKGLKSFLVDEGGGFPFSDNVFDVCILDNVLEHILDPFEILNECWRVTAKDGGLVVSVPGLKGYDSDADHKIFYDQSNLRNIHPRWDFQYMYALPSGFLSDKLSRWVRQYCVVAVYKKVAA